MKLYKLSWKGLQWTNTSEFHVSVRTSSVIPYLYVTAITFSLTTVSINCFMGCTVPLLLCALPLIYSPVSTPPTAVGLWNVTKNCNEYPLCDGPPVCKLCGITTWLLEGWSTSWTINRATVCLVSFQQFFFCDDFGNLIQRMWNKLGTLGALRRGYLFIRHVLDVELLFSSQMLLKQFWE